MHPEDAEIVSGCLAGRAKSWEQLVRLHAPVMMRAATAISPPDAHDVVQRVLLRLLEDGARRLRAFGGRSRLATWLVAVVRREALSSRVEREPPLSPTPRARPPDELAAEHEDRARLAAALDRLPARDRLLIELLHLGDCSYAEVAREPLTG